MHNVTVLNSVRRKSAGRSFSVPVLGISNLLQLLSGFASAEAKAANWTHYTCERGRKMSRPIVRHVWLKRNFLSLWAIFFPVVFIFLVDYFHRPADAVAVCGRCWVAPGGNQPRRIRWDERAKISWMVAPVKVTLERAWSAIYRDVSSDANWK